MDIKILVAYHKESTLIENEVFMPVQVGKQLSNCILEMQGDNEGDNISGKNSTYCEMTAVYWAWKNLSCDYYGLCHYRRLFSSASFPILEKIKMKLSYLKAKILNFYSPGYCLCLNSMIHISDEKSILFSSDCFARYVEKKLADMSIHAIVPYPIYFSGLNVYRFFGDHIFHFNLLLEILKEKYPLFYPYVKDCLFGNKLYSSNMFIMKYDVFDQYCNLIFPILEEHRKKLLEMRWCYDLDNEKCFARVSGYIAEVLTSAFIMMLIKYKKNVQLVHVAYYSVDNV